MTAQPPPPAGSLDLVTRSFESAWQRMTGLLFRPLRVKAWLLWGLLIALAGLAHVGIGSRWGDHWRGDDFPGSRLGGAAGWQEEGLALVMVLFGVFIALVLLLTYLYIRSRFRFVLLEAVISGEPRVTGVFGSTGRDALAYFLYELATWLALSVFAFVP
ncbi:MAG: hypothetical protein Q9Q13_08545, partial [Acidobacteriota bacterium]|nr:hypothetical protein [Acidobacteriota bacterium]